MKISLDEIRSIARLAKLRFSDEEMQKLAEEFESMLSHFETICKRDSENTKLKECENIGPKECKNIELNRYLNSSRTVTRPDINTSFDDKRKLFQNAKSMSDSYIKVPKVIE